MGFLKKKARFIRNTKNEVSRYFKSLRELGKKSKALTQKCLRADEQGHNLYMII